MNRWTRCRTNLWKPLVLALLFCAALPAFGQGCALCYTQAASAGHRLIQALRSGILVLIFPPMGICIGLIIASYRKRNLCGEPSNALRRVDQTSDLGW